MKLANLRTGNSRRGLLLRFHEGAVAVEAHALSAPFDMVADKSEQPDGGLEQVLERREPEGERGAWSVERYA